MNRWMWIVLVVLLSPPVFGGEGALPHWEFAGWYGGGCYPNVEFDPLVKDRVYLTSDVSGIWRSDNLGEGWQFITNGLTNVNVAQIAVAPTNSDVLYAAAATGVFYSLNAGQKWNPADRYGKRITFSRPESYRAIAVDPQNPRRVCVGTIQGVVLCSTNYGQKWTDLNSGQSAHITGLAFSPADKSLYVAGDEGMRRYDFKTKTWQVFDAAPKKITDFIFSIKSASTIYAAGHHTLWISDDAGASWRQSTKIPQGIIFRLALADAKEDHLIVGWTENYNGGILVTKDQGKMWVPIQDQFNADIKGDPSRSWAVNMRRMTSLKVDPFRAGTLFLTDWWGVWRSDDAGAIWNEKIRGAPNTVGSDIAIAGQGQVYVATMDDGLLKSNDGGMSYTSIFPKTGYKHDINGHVWRVLVRGENIVAASSPWADQTNQVIVSSDGGKSFKVVRQGLPTARPSGNTMWGEGYPRALAADPMDPNMLYLGIDGDNGGGLFISHDGGNSWQRSEGQPEALRIYNGLVVDIKNPNIVYWAACGDKGRVYKSTDRGKTWKKVFSESTWVFDLHMSTDGTLYAGGAASAPVVYASKDQGASWNKVGSFSNEGSSSVEGIASAPGKPGLLALSTVGWGNVAPQKIYLSRNAGKTWTDVTGDLPPGTGAAAIAFDSESGFLYMSRYAGSVYRMKF